MNTLRQSCKMLIIWTSAFVAFLGIGETPFCHAQGNAPNEILQFTAGGHVLGFKPDAFYMASGTHALRVEFVGAQGVKPVSDNVSPDVANTKQALPLTKVTYPNLWQGITLVYERTDNSSVESTYFVEPNAKVENIRLKYNVPVRIEADGSLHLEFETGNISETPPVAWQEIRGKKVPVSVAFRKISEKEAGFSLGQYDPAFALVIDPIVKWNTFMGGSDLKSIALDSKGNILMVGTAANSWGIPINAYADEGSNAVIVKLDSNGNYIWHTFLGGLGNREGLGIATDSGDNIYVAIGRSPGAYIAKLNSNGERLMGFSVSIPAINAIVVDKGGNVFVIGNCDISWGDHIINPYAGEADAFVAKIDSNGNILWNTFLGSILYDRGYDIAVDNSGNIYVCGESNTSWGDHIINPKSGNVKGTDAFVAKLDSNGNMLWNTFMGAAYVYDMYESYDRAYAIALDSSGNIYVTGYSSSSWGNPISNTGNTFVAKLDNSGNLKWNTFMQGNSDDLAIDENSNIYIAGTCSSSWGMPITPYAGGDDACIAKFDNNGNLFWNTFMGSSSDDSGYSIAYDGVANIYVGGISTAGWGNPISDYTGGPFVAKISISDATVTSIDSNSPNGTYIIGTSIIIRVNFSEPVTLNGTLNVKLNTGAVVSIPSFAASTFAVGGYIVGAGESASQLNATEISLTGTLKDLSGTDVRNISLPAENIASTKNIVIDGVAPNPPIITALTPTFNTSPKWTLSSGGGGSGVFRYKLDNSSLNSGAIEKTSYVPFDYVAPLALAAGFHTLYAQEKDAAGNWSPISSLSVQIVSSAPSVFGSSVPLTTTTPTWTWSGLTGLGGTGHFRIMLDSSDFSTGFTLSDATTFIPANALTQGNHTLYVQEKDTADFWSQIGSADITIESPAEAIYASPNNLLIEEPEGTGEFTVRLAVKPTADVLLEMLSTDTTVCTVSPSFITLTPDNWNSSATVTVKDAPFNLVNTQGCSIVFKSAISEDPYFNGKNTNMVSVTVRDDAAFTVYSVQPRYGVEGKYLTVNISGDGFDENTQVFYKPYKPDGGVETEATRSIIGSTIINLTLPDQNQSALPTAPQRYQLRITDGQKNFEETVFIVKQDDLDAIKRKKAIIVAGGGTGYSGDYLWTATRFCTDKANAALQFQGYTPSNIMYLAAGSVKPDKDAKVDNFRKAVTEWGRQPYYTEYAIDELLIYMTGHGNDGTFTLKGSSDTTLSADELKLWLDALQEKGNIRVILIYDACQSGSFVEKLKNPLYERIILTSANANQSALFADNGKLSFSETFWATVMNNGRLYRSFKNAEGDMNGMGQFPQIEIPSKYSYTDPELDLKIGLGLMTAASPIDIKTVCPDVILDCGKNSAEIWVENIVPSNYVQGVSAKIRYADQTLTPNMTVHELPLLPDATDFRYAGRFDSFFESGTYFVSISALTMNDKESERVYLKIRKVCGVVNGDVDGSNIVDLADAISALRILSGISVSANRSADVNSDGRIGLEEAVYILQTVARLK